MSDRRNDPYLAQWKPASTSQRRGSRLVWALFIAGVAIFAVAVVMPFVTMLYGFSAALAAMLHGGG